MAQYAYSYNDIFDDFVVQTERGNAAPQRNPNRPNRPNQRPDQRPNQTPGKRQEPPVRKFKKSKEQVILENKRKFKIALAKFSIVFAMFAAMFLMAAVSRAEVYDTRAELAAVEESYQLCLEQNNKLKLQLNKAMEKIDIEDYAKEELGLVKASSKRAYKVDISLYQ